MKVKLVKKIKKNTPLEKDEPDKEQKVEDQFAAMQLIKGYCKSRDECQKIVQPSPKDCCPFFTPFGSTWCALQNDPPCAWPDTLFYTKSNTGKLV